MNEETGTDQSRPTEPDWARRERIDGIRKRVFGGDLLTVNDAADVLQIHPRTVTEYIRDGRLDAFQLGGAWKITEDALAAFVHELRAGELRAGEPQQRQPDAKAKRRMESLRGEMYGIGVDETVSAPRLAELAEARAQHLIPQLHGIGMKGRITAAQLLELARGNAVELIAQLHGIGLNGPISAAQLVELVRAGGAEAIYPLYAMNLEKPVTAEKLVAIVTGGDEED